MFKEHPKAWRSSKSLAGYPQISTETHFVENLQGRTGEKGTAFENASANETSPMDGNASAMFERHDRPVKQDANGRRRIGVRTRFAFILTRTLVWWGCWNKVILRATLGNKLHIQLNLWSMKSFDVSGGGGEKEKAKQSCPENKANANWI